ncbi:hypothetical protein [Streptomyces achromogenes]|uniref:hypothetical protein n=1 Tax=Streptomyces achromogenes TaxID=67255 RepID=UPI003F4CC1CB
MSQLDPRIEAATGHDVDTLWAHRDRGLLDATHAELVDRHRELASAETGVTFHRTLLHRLSSGEYPVDTALFRLRCRRSDQERGRPLPHNGADSQTGRPHNEFVVLSGLIRADVDGADVDRGRRRPRR